MSVTEEGIPSFLPNGQETPEERRARKKEQKAYIAELPPAPEFNDTPKRFQRLFGHAINGVSEEDMKRLMAEYDAAHPTKEQD